MHQKSHNMRKLALLFTGLLWHCSLLAQELPFWNEIKAFKEQDSLQMPPKDGILFVGSSSIRMWDNLQEAFPHQTVLNRGFGGSNLLDLKHYLSDIVFPYRPKQIIIYSGENDIASGTVQAQEVLARFEDVFQAIRQEMPQVPITFVSIKPSPSRWEFKPTIEEANRLIRAYLRKQPKTSYADVYPLMLNQNKRPKPEIFSQDSLHMNRKGYQIWQKTIAPHLSK